MSSTDPFKLLGLDRATATEADVKRAYAKKLKETRPEEDRAGFMDLRAAFTAARGAAKHNDVRRAAAGPETPASTPQPQPQEERPKPRAETKVEWIYHKDIDWSCRSDAQGQLALRTLRWMQAGGPDGDAFVRDFMAALDANPEIDRSNVAQVMLSFIQARAGKDQDAYDLDDWQEFEITRPDWLTDAMMRQMCGPLGLFDYEPTETWHARDYNIVLTLFRSVLSDAFADKDAPRPKDVKSLFEQEHTANFGDDHGSYFDRDKMEWMDMSPVAVAMRDIQAGIDRGLWDVAVRVKEVLDREALQPLDEFQDIEARMRNLVCSATGWNTNADVPTYPAWLTADMIRMLDDTFGWSRQSSRNAWERRQFSWLHTVISRDVEIARPAKQFKAQKVSKRAQARAVARPHKPSSLAVVLAGLYAKPHRLILGYLGYRLLQFLARLAV